MPPTQAVEKGALVLRSTFLPVLAAKRHLTNRLPSFIVLDMANAKRIVIKLGTSVLTAGTGGLSRPHILTIVQQAAQLVEAGHLVVIVSSGAIAAGREALNFPDLDRSVPARQMLSAVGQGRLIQLYSELFSGFGLIVGQVLLTRGDLSNRTGYLNARDTLITLL